MNHVVYSAAEFDAALSVVLVVFEGHFFGDAVVAGRRLPKLPQWSVHISSVPERRPEDMCGDVIIGGLFMAAFCWGVISASGFALGKKKFGVMEVLASLVIFVFVGVHAVAGLVPDSWLAEILQ